MIELADAIRELRAQLATAIVEGKDEKLRFGLGPIELELQVAATNKGGGGVKIWVVEAEGEVARESLQKLKLVLKPEWSAGTDVKIAATGNRADVAGSGSGSQLDSNLTAQGPRP